MTMKPGPPGRRQPGQFTIASASRGTAVVFAGGVSPRLLLHLPSPTGCGVPLTPGEWRVIATCLRLSVRESEIARLMLDDVAEADIASRLSISPRTVHGHLERVYRKLGVHSRYQLVIRLFSAYLSSCAGRTIDPA